LRGEEYLVSKFANAVITPTDYGLSKFVADDLMWLGGMKNREALGGQLHLTTYRPSIPVTLSQPARRRH
jgi:hypothetical protein